jgi:hypothetical protein
LNRVAVASDLIQYVVKATAADGGIEHLLALVVVADLLQIGSDLGQRQHISYLLSFMLSYSDDESSFDLSAMSTGRTG